MGKSYAFQDSQSTHRTGTIAHCYKQTVESLCSCKFTILVESRCSWNLFDVECGDDNVNFAVTERPHLLSHPDVDDVLVSLKKRKVYDMRVLLVNVGQRRSLRLTANFKLWQVTCHTRPPDT